MKRPSKKKPALPKAAKAAKPAALFVPIGGGKPAGARGGSGSNQGDNDPLVSAERVYLDKQARFNPIRTLNPETLTRYLDLFQYGELRWAALLWDALERRDDVLKSVIPKRRKSVARRSWEVIASDDSPEAQTHKETLENFYRQLSCTNAIDLNCRGGFRLLIEQMLDSVGKYYSVHHIVWKPSSDGITAQFYHVPLWFFENRTGRLRFLPQEYETFGQELDPGEWMVTSGDGLMEACSVAYMYKHLPLKDWLIYCERHGMPGFQGKTAAPIGSDAWKVMLEAVRSISADFSCVTSLTDVIEKIDTSAAGELPYPALVERMDRAISSLWRGSDLSTMSAKGEGRVGASVQGKETELLEDDDCQLVSDTLHEQVDRWVIYYQHGTLEPLARVNITKPSEQDVAQDLEVDEFLASIGVPQSFDQIAERYGRTLPEGVDGKQLVQPKAPIQDPTITGLNERGAVADRRQRRFLKAASRRIAQAQDGALAPIRKRIREILAGNDADFPAQVEALKADLPALLKTISADPATVQAWAEVLGTSLASGLTGEIS